MIFTCTPRWNGSIQQALDNFFDRNILYLSFVDLEALSHEKWKNLLSTIHESVIKNNIEIIFIDRTGDPAIIDNPTPIAPSNFEMLDALSKLTTSYIVTEDYYYYYNPTPGVIFFPYQLWVFASKNIHKYYKYQDTVYDTALEKTKPLMCLNRNPQWHRIFMFSLLAEKSWFDDISYSFLNKIGDRLDNRIAVKQFLTQDEYDLIRSFEYLLPINLDNEPVLKDIPIMYHDGAGSVDSKVYAEHAINLVTETSLTDGVLFTEKTCKSFMAYQIPLLVAPVGANQFLEDIGLDMFSDYIPWKSWDSEPDHKTRMRLIVKFLDQIMCSPFDILQAHQNFYKRLIKNKEYFHSKEFENLLLEQILKRSTYDNCN
jgi:hypothetical protein